MPKTAAPKVIASRWKAIKGKPILKGAHDPDGKMCVMEAVAFVAGEPWSDHPECACSIISTFLRKWNDDMNDADRQMLKPFIPRLVGTRSTAKVENRRGWMLTDWMIRVHTPAWLELAGLNEQADTLRALPEFVDDATAEKSQSALNEVQEKTSAAESAAWSAARSAAWSAAESAAESAAWSAAESVAWSAARSAAESAARSAAWSAARSAAESAAWSAARSAAESAARSAARSAAESAAWSAAESVAWSAAELKVTPTKISLQASALELLEKMIAAA